MEKGGEATIDLKRDGIEDLSGRVHLLPCCIKHDGPTEVSHYFKPKPTGIVREDGLQLQQSHFRGRLLEGSTLHLPPNYSGSYLIFLSFFFLSEYEYNYDYDYDDCYDM
jgi:ribonuclease H2 subunit C